MTVLKSQNFDKMHVEEEISAKICNLFQFFFGKKFCFVVPNFEANLIHAFAFYPNFKAFSFYRGGRFDRTFLFYDHKGLICIQNFCDAVKTPEMKFLHRSKCERVTYFCVGNMFGTVLNGIVRKRDYMLELQEFHVIKQYEDSILVQFALYGEAREFIYYESCELRDEKVYFCSFSPGLHQTMCEYIEDEGKNTCNLFKDIQNIATNIDIFDLNKNEMI